MFTVQTDSYNGNGLTYRFTIRIGSDCFHSDFVYDSNRLALEAAYQLLDYIKKNYE